MNTDRALPPRGVNAESWDEIRGFSSPGEFERFQGWLSEAVAEGALVEVPVADRYGESEMLDEHWYRAASGQLWRVVTPEPPFQGAFLLVDA